jgi:hypothetical protein
LAAASCADAPLAAKRRQPHAPSRERFNSAAEREDLNILC